MLILSNSIFLLFRYPNCVEDFFDLRLPGEFDPAKVGTRMKLPIPLTWETQISK